MYKDMLVYGLDFNADAHELMRRHTSFTKKPRPVFKPAVCPTINERKPLERIDEELKTPNLVFGTSDEKTPLRKILSNKKGGAELLD